MDGAISPWIAAARRRARALAALVGVIIPIATLAPGTAAQADVGPPPATQFAPGPEPMLLAQQIARSHWGMDPCGGNVAIEWAPAAVNINAIATWSNASSAYDAPAENFGCSIQLNPLQSFDWDKFCSVLVHEYGHLAGRAHTDDTSDVMAANYARPLSTCVSAVAAPTPSQAVARGLRTTSPHAQKSFKAKAGRKAARARAAHAPSPSAERAGQYQAL